MKLLYFLLRYPYIQQLKCMHNITKNWSEEGGMVKKLYIYYVYSMRTFRSKLSSSSGPLINVGRREATVVNSQLRDNGLDRIQKLTNHKKCILGQLKLQPKIRHWAEVYIKYWINVLIYPAHVWQFMDNFFHLFHRQFCNQFVCCIFSFMPNLYTRFHTFQLFLYLKIITSLLFKIQ